MIYRINTQEPTKNFIIIHPVDASYASYASKIFHEFQDAAFAEGAAHGSWPLMNMAWNSVLSLVSSSPGAVASQDIL